MPGYEDLTSEEIMHLANMALAAVIVIMASKIIPAILNYRATKYLSLKIETKYEKQNKPKTVVEWLIEKYKERKKKKEKNYQPYYIPAKK